MIGNAVIQIGFYFVVLALLTKPLGAYIANVYQGRRTFADPVFRPVERLLYRMTGVDEKREMPWTFYTLTMLAFSVVSFLLLYLIQRTQTGDGYNASASGGSNLGPTNPALFERIDQTIAEILAANPERGDEQIPIDLVTASGSGLDPHISPAGAEYQVPRIARERGISEDQVRDLIDDATDGRFLGFLGEEGVNVLKLNLALDEAAPLASNSAP